MCHFLVRANYDTIDCQAMDMILSMPNISVGMGKKLVMASLLCSQRILDPCLARLH
jgi:hypothetical protein